MRRAVAAAGWVVLAAGCEQPRTELVVRVDSEVAWGPGRTVQSVVVTVRRDSATGPLRSTRTTALGVGGERRPLPLLVGIVPTDDTDTPVWIEALGCRAPNGCTAADAAVAQRAVVRFAVGQTQEVPLLLASACVGVTCGSDERCGDGGRCEPATRATVRPFDGIDAGTMADVAVDAGRIDVARDVPIIGDISADIMLPIDAPMVDILATDTAPPVDAPTPDTAASCGALELRCGGACVAVLTDPANCGACGQHCDDANPCTDDNCDGRGRCVHAANDSAACEDGNPCTRGDHCRGGSCVPGVCAPLTCPAGMRLIPAGMFLMGATDFAPIHGVQLTAFCMDETEVTVSAYATCTDCTAPGTGMYANWGVAGRESHPVNYVDWNQARAFCQSRGNDLPTEAQWEYAARGTDGRTYPWGNDDPASQLCWRGDVPTRPSTCPVRTYPLGNSPFGLFDMAGNVWEWTADYYAAYTGSAGSYVLNPTGPVGGSSRVVRGGSWSDTSTSYVRASYRVNYYFAPSNRGNDVGFRCARRPL